METYLFYILGGITLLATLLCITRSNPVHAVIFLVHGIFSLALIFYLLGAPLVAAWEVIIYAGAIMVLFMFIIMMLELAPSEELQSAGLQRWIPVLLLSGAILACTVLIIISDPASQTMSGLFYATPHEFGLSLFRNYPLAIEVISFQLLFAAVGAFYIGRPADRGRQPNKETDGCLFHCRICGFWPGHCSASVWPASSVGAISS